MTSSRRELWNDLFDPCLEFLQVDSEEPLSNLTILTHVLLLELQKTRVAFKKLLGENEAKTKEIITCKAMLSFTPCSCRKKNSHKKTEATKVKSENLKNVTRDLSNDLENEINMSTDLFIDDTVTDFQATSPKLDKRIDFIKNKKRRLNCSIKSQEGCEIKQSYFVAPKKISSQKRLKQSKLDISYVTNTSKKTGQNKSPNTNTSQISFDSKPSVNEDKSVYNNKKKYLFLPSPDKTVLGDLVNKIGCENKLDHRSLDFLSSPKVSDKENSPLKSNWNTDPLFDFDSDATYVNSQIVKAAHKDLKGQTAENNDETFIGSQILKNINKKLPEKNKLGTNKMETVLNKLFTKSEVINTNGMKNINEKKVNSDDDDAKIQDMFDSDNSFDYVPKNRNSPDYVYKRGAVRKKAEREKLEGWACRDCEQYYKNIKGLTEAELKKKMNECSRHRDKYPPKPDTPSVFWDPDFTYEEEEK